MKDPLNQDEIQKICKVEEDSYINDKLERSNQGKWRIPVFVMPPAKEEQASQLRCFSPMPSLEETDGFLQFPFYRNWGGRDDGRWRAPLLTTTLQ